MDNRHPMIQAKPSRRLFIPLLLLGMLCGLNSTFGKSTLFPVASTPQKLSPLMERELRGCFDFFWEEWNSDPKSPTYGMTNGDYIGIHNYVPLAIEEQGFYFAAIVIGVERGWITREEGEKRITITLETLKKLKRINGFWYHSLPSLLQRVHPSHQIQKLLIT